jgi:hypothetical protein
MLVTATTRSTDAMRHSALGLTEKNSIEQLSSGIPLKADVAQYSRHFAFVRTGEIATFVSFLAKRKLAPSFVAQRVGHINCQVGRPP